MEYEKKKKLEQKLILWDQLLLPYSHKSKCGSFRECRYEINSREIVHETVNRK